MRNKQVNNTSGYVGVSYDVSRDKYKSYIKEDGKLINLGRYDTIEEAVDAREKFIKMKGIKIGT